MGKAEPYQNRIELLQGTLDMLILRTLQWGAQHGVKGGMKVSHRGGGKGDHFFLL